MNSMYAKARERFGQKQIDWRTGHFVVLLVNHFYVPDYEAHDLVADIGLSAVIAQSSELTGKTITNGFADANGCVFPALSSDYPVGTVVVAELVDGIATHLIFGAQDGINLPASPQGEDWYVIWDDAFGGIFRL